MTTHTTHERPPEAPLRVAVIVGSTRENRLGPKVADWFVEQARGRPELEIDVLDLLELDLPHRLGVEDERATAYRERLATADAFVVVTPEYNHGYPAPLKQAIDLAHAEWRAKPVGFVSYGGRSGGLRAVEQLRLVFAELHATTIRDVVSLHEPWGLFDRPGPIGAEPAAAIVLDELAWWATALRRARTSTPYAA